MFREHNIILGQPCPILLSKSRLYLVPPFQLFLLLSASRDAFQSPLQWHRSQQPGLQLSTCRFQKEGRWFSPYFCLFSYYLLRFSPYFLLTHQQTWNRYQPELKLQYVHNIIILSEFLFSLRWLFLHISWRIFATLHLYQLFPKA